jgi:glucosamine-6-phosphate deaminase
VTKLNPSCIRILADKQALGRAAASEGAVAIRAALKQKGCANIVVATGASQFEMLAELVAAPEIDWSKVTCFHLDEYVGLSSDHSASFRKYLRERFVEKLPVPPKEFCYVRGEGNPAVECLRLNALLTPMTIDVAFIGIGENGHLAFNDPPADFETESPYIVVNLDDACRQQQFGEGWFPTLNDVPTTAISMSICQILKADRIICTVPDARKAEAVKNAVEGPVTNMVPASALQKHPRITLFLDPASASLLTKYA